ncbi:hypothetical protein SAMN05216349_12124 [Oribacterium sp. KHPX15]|uniref:Cof-type HAD-IIB family hydrolase n=1 Tax=Oribacterium sp. KHPX15 TaxID=1855342 RepID=UPI00089D3BAD|nr:Cof-type HAD-IIB family hydrolase [Oribacterium sp. KHPX15]SEA65885.1 hypothetical protein SAMN05216349_12124 [Oribacterium sp. KHPX15]
MEKNKYRVIFTDIDGTLLNSDHRISEKTVTALKIWTDSGRELVLASSRGISGIEPIIRRYNLSCSVIALGGSVIRDKNGSIIYEAGMNIKIVKAILEQVRIAKLPAAWSAYSVAKWIANSKDDPGIINEAAIVEASPTGYDLSLFSDNEKIGKVLLFCKPGTIDMVEESLKGSFPELSIAKSSDILLEINPKGITKASAVHEYCRIKGIALENTIAFGDNYNDLHMLETVGRPVIMGNAPADLRSRFNMITLDNDHDGIATALEKIMC